MKKRLTLVIALFAVSATTAVAGVTPPPPTPPPPPTMICHHVFGGQICTPA